MNTLLDAIHDPSDLRGLSDQEMDVLAEEIRQFLLENVSQTGGHLSSNLGVVELTLALHKTFSSPKDKIIWDVGHQSYVHKILTGRKDKFPSLRKEDGLSGFPKEEESPHDAFNTGHASTSISAAYGLAKARDLQHEEYEVIAVIGDGSLTGGMAYEALNNAGKGETKLIVILNDNQMSISSNVGILPYRLSQIRTRHLYLETKEGIRKGLAKIPKIGIPISNWIRRVKRRMKYMLVSGVLFEELGFVYLGPVDGHNCKELQKVFQQARNLDEPVLIHVRTVKGKGYEPAEENATRFHGVPSFDIESGNIVGSVFESWSEVLGRNLVRLARKYDNLVAITAAMVQNTGLEEFSHIVPDRVFDVGIAEEHAVTFAAGLAKGGLKPVVAIYSSFLQRAYDQILHDVCLQNLPVVFAIDRSGIVGEDGETHQGIYDIAYLSHIPGMTIMAPSCRLEMVAMLEYAVSYPGPIALRYPKGRVYIAPSEERRPPIVQGRGYIYKRGARVAILTVGVCRSMAEKAAKLLKQEGISPTLADARFIAPIDETLLEELASEHDLLVTVEDHIHTGGFGMQVAAFLSARKYPCEVQTMALPDKFIEQGTRESLLTNYGLCPDAIAERVRKFLARGEHNGGKKREA